VKEGDFFALPADSRAEHYADADAAFYWVHDEPLLRYLGVKADARRFEPTLYPREKAVAVLDEVEKDPKAAVRSRVSVLLANEGQSSNAAESTILARSPSWTARLAGP
jgi:hypothetical protein